MLIFSETFSSKSCKRSKAFLAASVKTKISLIGKITRFFSVKHFAKQKTINKKRCEVSCNFIWILCEILRWFRKFNNQASKLISIIAHSSIWRFADKVNWISVSCHKQQKATFEWFHLKLYRPTTTATMQVSASASEWNFWGFRRFSASSLSLRLFCVKDFNLHWGAVFDTFWWCFVLYTSMAHHLFTKFSWIPHNCFHLLPFQVVKWCCKFLPLRVGETWKF